MPAKPKPPKQKKSDRKIVEKQLEDIVKAIIMWRDGQVCVEAEMDGVHCRPGVQWGHVIPQGISPWLRHDLSNVFCQCPNHNYMHHNRDPIYNLWYIKTFGVKAFEALVLAQKEHVGKKRTIGELREKLDRYTDMYENRPCFFDVARLVDLGYYGELIKFHWFFVVK